MMKDFNRCPFFLICAVVVIANFSSWVRIAQAGASCNVINVVGLGNQLVHTQNLLRDVIKQPESSSDQRVYALAQFDGQTHGVVVEVNSGRAKTLARLKNNLVERTVRLAQDQRTGDRAGSSMFGRILRTLRTQVSRLSVASTVGFLSGAVIMASDGPGNTFGVAVTALAFTGANVYRAIFAKTTLQAVRPSIDLPQASINGALIGDTSKLILVEVDAKQRVSAESVREWLEAQNMKVEIVDRTKFLEGLDRFKPVDPDIRVQNSVINKNMRAVTGISVKPVNWDSSADITRFTRITQRNKNFDPWEEVRLRPLSFEFIYVDTPNDIQPQKLIGFVHLNEGRRDVYLEHPNLSEQAKVLITAALKESTTGSADIESLKAAKVDYLKSLGIEAQIEARQSVDLLSKWVKGTTTSEEEFLSYATSMESALQTNEVTNDRLLEDTLRSN